MRSTRFALLGLIIPLPRTGCDVPQRLPILSPPISVDGAREVILAFRC
jgi:hypothetical protein